MVSLFGKTGERLFFEKGRALTEQRVCRGPSTRDVATIGTRAWPGSSQLVNPEVDALRDHMRIIGGDHKGRALLGPKNHEVIRPTADRVRQTIFDVLGQRCDGQSVLDLYAGTGALALEALSRGAAAATLVDSGREAQLLCRQNAAALGLTIELLAMPVTRGIELLIKRGAQFDLIFIDPPYADRVGAPVLEAVAPLLAAGGQLLLEHDKREAVPETVGELQRIDERVFGDTRVSRYQRR